MAWYRKARHLCDRDNRIHARSPQPRNGSWRGWLIALGALCLLGALDRPAGAQTTCPSGTPQSTTPATFNFDAYTQGQPFTLNTCNTTTVAGTPTPPWANIVSNTTSNFLDCTSPTGPATQVPPPQQVALCYYSGPAGTVPCELTGNGTASCTCYVLPIASDYSVDINAISNLDVYSDTVLGTPSSPACGAEGDGCTSSNQAAVCTSINNNTLIPGAALVSVFSDYLAGNTYGTGSDTKTFPDVGVTNSCATATYAGCMTAPCSLTGTTDPVTTLPLATCTCPTYVGPYQVPGKTTACSASATNANLVMSASYTSSTLTGTAPPGSLGVPGTANCNGVTESALAHDFGGISKAAKAMGFGSVQDLKSAIQTFCGKQSK